MDIARAGNAEWQEKSISISDHPSWVSDVFFPSSLSFFFAFLPSSSPFSSLYLLFLLHRHLFLLLFILLLLYHLLLLYLLLLFFFFFFFFFSFFFFFFRIFGNDLWRCGLGAVTRQERISRVKQFSFETLVWALVAYITSVLGCSWVCVCVCVCVCACVRACVRARARVCKRVF